MLAAERRTEIRQNSEALGEFSELISPEVALHSDHSGIADRIRRMRDSEETTHE